MSAKIMAEVWEHSQAKGTALLLLLALADYADSVRAECWPSIRRLSLLIRMSERNTQYLLRKLAAGGLIAMQLRGSPRKTNLYQRTAWLVPMACPKEISMRTVLIRIEGAKPRIRKLQLREGTRVSDILRYLKIPEGYCLTRASDPTRPLPQEAEAHALVADADYLIARSSSAAVGNAEAFTLTLAN